MEGDLRLSGVSGRRVEYIGEGGRGAKWRRIHPLASALPLVVGCVVAPCWSWHGAADGGEVTAYSSPRFTARRQTAAVAARVLVGARVYFHVILFRHPSGPTLPNRETAAPTTATATITTASAITASIAHHQPLHTPAATPASIPER